MIHFTTSKKCSSMKDLKTSPISIVKGLNMRRVFPSWVSLRPLFQREGNNTTCTVTADCSARRRSPTQTTPLLLPCHRHRHHRRRPLHLCHRRRSRSVGRSVAVVGAAFTIAVRPPSDGPTDTAHPSFQVVEVELVAHLPTDWEKRGRGATRFKGPLSLSLSLSLFLGKKQSDERNSGKGIEELQQISSAIEGMNTAVHQDK